MLPGRIDPRSWIFVFGCFLGVLILVPERFPGGFVPRRFDLKYFKPGILVLALRALGALGALGAGLDGLGNRRPLRGLRPSCFMSYGWLGVLRDVSGRGSMRVIEDILLSKRDSGGKSKDKSRASCRKRSEREQGHEIIYKKVQVLIKILKNRAF